MPPKLIQYGGRILMLDIGGTKKNILQIALEGKHNGVMVRFGQTHCLYVEVPDPQVVTMNQIEETFYAKRRPQ